VSEEMRMLQVQLRAVEGSKKTAKPDFQGSITLMMLV
jgi:hypothetical protein